MGTERTILHVDMDAFFASVEQHDHPELKGKPVIVGGRPEDRRSVVSTASYEARRFGVHSAMPSATAHRLCPQGIFIHGNMKRYAEVSSQIMEILGNYSPDVHQISIDEASIDITGTELLFGKPEEVALRIKKEILEATGLTVSVGMASTKYLAKLASEVNKPDGFYSIPAGSEEAFMLSLPLKDVWGIGEKTLKRINSAGFFTTRDLHNVPEETLKMVFGENLGLFLYNVVRGKETGIMNEQPREHSISNEITFPYDLTDLYSAETALLSLSQSVMFRLLSKKQYSKTVTVKIRFDDFQTITVQETLEDYITSSDALFERAKALFEKKYDAERGIRLLGLGLSNVKDKIEDEQGSLFDFGENKRKAVEQAVLKINSKHPEAKLKKARLFEGNKK